MSTKYIYLGLANSKEKTNLFSDLNELQNAKSVEICGGGENIIIYF